MLLKKPAHIAQAAISTPELHYEWDEADLGKIFNKEGNDAFFDRINTISYRANTALAVAIAEWIVWRYETLSDDEIPYQFLEAGWAAVVDNRYNSLVEPNHDNEWQGPIRGPMSLAFMLIKEAIAVEERELELVPILNMTELAEHILPDCTAYLAWRDSVLDRLEKLYPLDSEETRGDVVPREVFDLSIGFDPDMCEILINQFLRKLDPSDNPILNTPEEMLNLRFDGEPFVFNEEQDRENRFNW